ncbi:MULTISPECIES: HAD-IIIC family phosphatase [unclassified Sphingobacterium]|uniref:HAD-IIIC family phosphatase n=1 Tax=unclassified Sphingobacterium TaxID=2609468 RepID=UPI0020C2306F|nr:MULTISPECIES: HAD-IIIC family phosphatase [unclassified Sphingobacterium]
MAKLETKNINSLCGRSQIVDNPFLSVYINDYIRKFRSYNEDEFVITISGLNSFISQDDTILNRLFEQLKQNKFTIENVGNKKNTNDIQINCRNATKNSSYNFKYQIQDIPTLIELSGKTDLPLIGIIITKIVAQIICKIKTLYKAVVLDLDDTLWFGTLSEIGIDEIMKNMKTEKGVSFIEFMKFVKTLGNELGIFIAICSRNDSKEVESAINELSEDIFPLKNQIDFIITNENDKSENIKIIANQLSILPSSILFIDDNQLVRDEVKSKLPEVFVPEWNNHNELVAQLIVGCLFERNELSLSSQNRRKEYRIIQTERNQNYLPTLSIKIINDNKHIESIKLYSKSNQFKFSSIDNDFHKGAKSVYFEILRENGENLGVCSAITYIITNSTMQILNWALSCRYFEIGVEEFILNFIQNIANKNKVFINYVDSGNNQKVNELILKYSDAFKTNDKNDVIEIIFTTNILEQIATNTNIIEFKNGKT